MENVNQSEPKNLNTSEAFLAFANLQMAAG